MNDHINSLTASGSGWPPEIIDAARQQSGLGPGYDVVYMASEFEFIRDAGDVERKLEDNIEPLLLSCADLYHAVSDAAHVVSCPKGWRLVGLRPRNCKGSVSYYLINFSAIGEI
jgi:hypothetical protein